MNSTDQVGRSFQSTLSRSLHRCLCDLKNPLAQLQKVLEQYPFRDVTQRWIVCTAVQCTNNSQSLPLSDLQSHGDDPFILWGEQCGTQPGTRQYPSTRPAPLTLGNYWKERIIPLCRSLGPHQMLRLELSPNEASAKVQIGRLLFCRLSL